MSCLKEKHESESDQRKEELELRNMEQQTSVELQKQQYDMMKLFMQRQQQQTQILLSLLAKKRTKVEGYYRYTCILQSKKPKICVEVQLPFSKHWAYLVKYLLIFLPMTLFICCVFYLYYFLTLVNKHFRLQFW